MANVSHKALPMADIHIPYAFSYADATTRGAATGFTSGDVGKLALQASDNTLWLLTATTPIWVAVGGSGGLTNPMTTQDDIIIGGASGTPERLAKGADGQVLTVDPTTHELVWATPSGGGGGGSISSGVYASRPAAGTAGALYLPTDTTYLYKDNGSAWQAWGPLYPLTPPVAAQFAWANQGTATLTDDGALNLSTGAAASGYNIRMQVKSAPATPYTITAACIVGMTGGVDAFGGICWRDSVGGGIVGLYTTYNGLNLSKWSNPTTPVASYASFDARATFRGLVWLRLTDDGTNRVASYSGDGVNWLQMYSVARTDFITPNQVGFLVSCGSASSQVALRLMSWKES